MKEIGFRYWDPFNEAMIYNYQFQMLSYFFEKYDEALYGGNNPVLMQFTGLQDANGRDIYEGDILTSHMGRLTVIFDYGEFIAKIEEQPDRWPYIMHARFFPQVKIVGNIYETAEMEKN